MVVEDIAFYLFLVLCVIELLLLYYLMRTFLSIELLVYRLEKKLDVLETKVDTLDIKTDDIQATMDHQQRKKHQQ